ncbi:MAG: N-6 DNA methylase [Cardiobacteriaceae bacterium]|nr:N-6 DNA methylase [Cardiobacteriaceae bacterium]
MKETKRTEEKNNGRYYTPIDMVCFILNTANYCGNNILQKHIIDNSCGDGAFLCEIVRRYCETAFKKGYSTQQLKNDLEHYIHGIEIEKTEHQKCIDNLNKITELSGIYNIEWDIKNRDALTVQDYNGKMDFVVGNPPYVRVHNLLDYSAVKQFYLSQQGMTDLYIVFYEIGINMLNKTGVLCYINPSSLFNSLAAKLLRKNLIQNKLLKKVIDLKHTQIFNATTYTAIILLTQENNKYIKYTNFENQQTEKLNYNEFYIDENFYFSNKNNLKKIKNIIFRQPEKNIIDVKNGFATLCDNFFIGQFDFEEYTIPIIKSSTGTMAKCFYPYDKTGKYIPFDELIKVPKIKNYYFENEERLKSRSLENKNIWHVFGRSQGILDTWKNKYAINALIRNIDDIKLTPCPAGTGSYSGLYILTELSFNELKRILFQQEFVDYIQSLGKYKQGGYYTFSSKDLLKYLDYKIVGDKNEQSDLFECA